MRKDLLLTGLMLCVALLLTLGGSSKGEDRTTHDGSVVSVDFGKLVLLERPGKQVTYTVADTVPITVMGKEVRLQDLKQGLQVRVTLDPKGEVAAITTVDPVKIVGEFPTYR